MTRLLGLARGVLLGALAAVLLFAGIAFVRVSSIDIESLATRDIGRSALMRQRAREAAAKGRRAHESRRPVPLARISPQLRQAVLVAEDDKFFSHEGFDWAGIRAAAEHNLKRRRGGLRGGSTITQQLAKNLWLGTSRTPWRKFEEMILAVRLENSLSKRRILELYLNTIEWGDGVYGAEAAARHWFGVSAASLDASQSVRLAAVIINPRRYSPVQPDRRIQRRVRTLASRLRRRGAIDESEYRAIAGLPPESPAPAVDSSLVAPPPTPEAPPEAPVESPSDTSAPHL